MSRARELWAQQTMLLRRLSKGEIPRHKESHAKYRIHVIGKQLEVLTFQQ